MVKPKKEYPKVIWFFKSDLAEVAFRVVQFKSDGSVLEACDDWDAMGNEVWTEIENCHVDDLVITIAHYFRIKVKSEKKK